MFDDTKSSNRIEDLYYVNGIRRVPIEEIIACLKAYAKATGWEDKLDKILERYNKVESSKKILNIFSSILESSMFNPKESNSLCNGHSHQNKEYIRFLSENGEDCSTIKFVTKELKTTKICLLECYSRKEKIIQKMIKSLDADRRLYDGTEITKDDGRYETNTHLGWRVGTLFQQQIFYTVWDDKKGFCCGLNQPEVNGRKIEMRELYKIIKEVESGGIANCNKSIGICTPYEFTKIRKQDADGSHRHSPIKPMVNTFGGIESKCFAKPLAFKSLDDMFCILTNHRINKDNFPRFFSSNPDPIQALNFGLHVVLACLRIVYGNLSTTQDYHELFLVLHLFQSRSKVMDLLDPRNHAPSTFPIGYKELVAQTVYKFQELTPIRLGWIDGQKRQAAVTTLTCGEKFFFNDKIYSKKIHSFDKHLFGKPLMEYSKEQFQSIQGSYPVTIVYVKGKNQNKLQTVTICEKVGISKLRELSILFQNNSSKGEKTSYENMLVNISKKNPELLWPIPENMNWVDHFFYKRWDCMGYVWEERPHDLTVELSLAQNKIINSKLEQIREQKSYIGRISTDGYGGNRNSKEIEWEVDYAIARKDGDVMSCMRLFQYCYFGRPNLLPRKDFLKDRDMELYKIEKNEEDTSQGDFSSQLRPTAYELQRELPANVPLKYFGHPRRAPKPRCAWTVIGYLTEYASGTPQTIKIMTKFIENKGTRDSTNYEFHNRASNHGERGNHDVLVYNYCEKRLWSYKVRGMRLVSRAEN